LGVMHSPCNSSCLMVGRGEGKVWRKNGEVFIENGELLNDFARDLGLYSQESITEIEEAAPLPHPAPDQLQELLQREKADLVRQVLK
jgi:hypothetical protein